MDAGSSFTSFQHTRWIWQSQNLPAGDLIPRDEVVSNMRELSLSLNNRHRLIAIPACLMLAGGLLIFISSATDRKRKEAEQDTAPNP